MKHTKIIHLLASQQSVDRVSVKGWLRTRRDSKGFSFLEVNDGSCLRNIQVIADENLGNYPTVKQLLTGSALAVSGKLVASSGSNQSWEIQAQEIAVISSAPDSYPLQKKRHSDEFLRTIAHLRPRTNKDRNVSGMRRRTCWFSVSSVQWSVKIRRCGAFSAVDSCRGRS